ncbi:MAG TPA: XdhC family protein [Candidatus Acidoferrum sp.]|nr:XdhC family protein [Candidatus Acidoferrum sp.]
MADTLLARAAELQRRGEPFALATVVRCEAPTSAKPGAKALVRQDGTVEGWVGGACAEPVVVREALHALRDGRPRLVGLYGEGGRTPDRTEGVLDYAMTCHSGGTLEIYVEPYLPVPLLVLVGHGPVVDTLATLGQAAGYAVVPLRDAAAWAGLDTLGLGRRASVVVATHADSDEDALARVLQTEAGYVSLVASRRRAASVVERLRQRGVPSERLGRFKAPAGLDLGAVTPAEIAVSILAEIIQHHRGDKLADATPVGISAEPTEAVDPICGMTVDIATARYHSQAEGRTTYFCCLHCKETFEQDPPRYLSQQPA